MKGYLNAHDLLLQAATKCTELVVRQRLCGELTKQVLKDGFVVIVQ